MDNKFDQNSENQQEQGFTGEYRYKGDPYVAQGGQYTDESAESSASSFEGQTQQTDSAWNSTQYGDSTWNGAQQTQYRQSTGADADPTMTEAQKKAQAKADRKRAKAYRKAQKKAQKTGRSGQKSEGLTGKKVVSAVVLAAIFGVVASGFYQGTNYIGERIRGGHQIQQTSNNSGGATQVGYTSTATGSAIEAGSVTSIAQQCMPSIVSITSTEEAQNYYDLFGNYNQGKESTSSGSGFIIGKSDTELLIATNNHVVDGAKTISVQFVDGEIYEATTKGTDYSADLAVIAVKMADIKESTLGEIRVATLGDSSDVQVGEMVVAIGNALGYGQSVTVGYVSAKDREIQEDSSSSNTIKVIQTDAAINPGNSGGALINMKGEVIGINSAKVADSTVEGMGYAIPISEATPIIDELKNKEELTDSQKGYLGISCKTVSSEMQQYGLPQGVYVSETAEGGPADKAGLQKGDVITKINDVSVSTQESLSERANSYKKGTEVTITYQRNSNGTYKENTVKVKLAGKDALNGLSDSGSNSSSQGGQSGNSDQYGGQDGQEGQDGSNGSGGFGDFWGSLFGY